MTSPVTVWILAAFAAMLVLVEPAQLDASVCNLPKETGKCRANIRRYHYNHHVGDCQTFIYGGCGGNANNFEDIEKCRLAYANNFEEIEKCRSACKPYNRVPTLYDQQRPTLYGQKKPTLYDQNKKQPRSQAGRLTPGGVAMWAVLGLVATKWMNIY